MTFTAKQIINILLSCTGQYASAKWRSTVKPAAAFKDLTIEKITTAVVRSGIDFSNLSSVKEGIESGERGEVGSLPWGQWKQFPYIIEHKGKNYVRLYPAKNTNQIPDTKFFVNGKEVSKQEVLNYVTPSTAKNMTERKEVECFTVTETNFLDIEK